jgi:hypothetical protein
MNPINNDDSSVTPSDAKLETPEQRAEWCHIHGLPVNFLLMTTEEMATIKAAMAPATPQPAGMGEWAVNCLTADISKILWRLGIRGDDYHGAVKAVRELALQHAPRPAVETGEQENISAIAAVIKEQLDKAEMWERHYKTDPAGKEDVAFWQGRARGLAEILDYVNRLLARLPAAPADGEDKARARLDFLLANISVEELQRILPKLSGRTVGDAIDAALSAAPTTQP